MSSETTGQPAAHDSGTGGWPDSPAERHRLAAATFGERVRGVTDWDAPTPVARWVARDVVSHLLGWFPGFLAAGCEHRLDEVPVGDEDLAEAWRRRSGQVQALLDQHGDDVFDEARLGRMSLSDVVDRFYTSDVVMHTWDLARATGQDDRLDPGFCEQALAGMEPMAEVLVASGQYGPRVPVPPDADVQDRLLGLIGRDPAWRPR